MALHTHKYLAATGRPQAHQAQGTTMPRAFHYMLSQNRLYLSVTAKHALRGKPFATLFHSRGPAFKLPGLPAEYEPTAEEMAQAVEDVYETDPRKKELAKIGMGELDEGVVFAGSGEPLLFLDRVIKATELIKERRHGVPVRLATTGIGSPKSPAETVRTLEASGVEHLSLFVPSVDGQQYAELMAGQSLSSACSFSVMAAEAGMKVNWVCVANKALAIGPMQSLALSCGAVELVVKEFVHQ